jgi:hypothetical protein
MATLSQLVAAIANAEGIDAERVAAIARAVREEGLIQTSGRGTSAAQMSESDAANLLIATNTADTARSAPVTIRQYRALQAMRRPTSEFGSELEELLSAVKRKHLADYITKMVTLLGTRGNRLAKRPYPEEEYRFEIQFEKPIPSVGIHIWIQRDPRGDYISFNDRRQPRAKTYGDRKERTSITHRTILAVADVLRT